MPPPRSPVLTAKSLSLYTAADDTTGTEDAMRSLPVLLLSLVLATLATTVEARDHGRDKYIDQREAATADGGMSLDQAVQMVQQRYGARVVRAETKSEGGRTVYVLKCLNSDGRVWTVRVDAQSGSVQ